jgi:hypothetical protein
MKNFIDIILERDDNKESIKKTYRTYSCVIIVKFQKRINRTQAIERIRAIKSVTVVESRSDDALETLNRKLKDYEYSNIELKFVTNKSAESQIDEILRNMVFSNEKTGHARVPGVIATKPKLETLKKLD